MHTHGHHHVREFLCNYFEMLHIYRSWDAVVMFWLSCNTTVNTTFTYQYLYSPSSHISSHSVNHMTCCKNMYYVCSIQPEIILCQHVDLPRLGIFQAGSHFMMWSFLIVTAPLLYGCWIVSVESQTQGEPVLH